ncbi:MAG: aminopeptidase P family protein [Dehalococcoidia bacterium]|nr:aminopeptidase P family protein [Dehalococcoidia bacterium]
MPGDSDVRQRLDARRREAARRWDLSRGVVLLPSGLPVPIAGTDQAHEFHSHPEHSYLAGVANPGAVLAFDPREGWTLFAHVASEEERVWSGDSEALEGQSLRSGLERALPAEQLGRWLEAHRGEPVAILGNHDLRHRPGDYGVERWPALELEFDEALAERLSAAISEMRRTKDAGELDAMRRAAAASRAGHLAGMRVARAGMTERDLQIEIEVRFFRSGAARTAYGSIVGGGPNGAVLHFAPTSRVLGDGELVLVDAGAEVDGYASDVTRTYPVGGIFQGLHRDLYQLVLGVQEQAIAGVRPGVEYRDLHMSASQRLADGLVQLGILRGDPADLVERDVHALFFPHGLGHMLGLATHDAGGCLAGRTPSDRFGLRYLRADLPLEPGYVVTIEPGIYFIPAILTNPARRESCADAVNWELADRLLGLGGIRVEDDVLVTETGADVLTSSIPKSISAIEALRAEGLGQ